MGLCAIVITYNEEKNIEACLRGLAFADEIVVLDSFSTDSTMEIARKFTDKVSCREFTGFSDQKNAAISMASEDWVIIVDADEVVTAELATEIRSAIDSGKYNAYRIPRSTYFLGKKIRHCGWYPDYQLRLARKSIAKIPDRLVHETMDVGCECGTLKSDLIHNSYPTMADYTRKMVEYARAAAQQKFNDGRYFRASDLLFNPGLTFFKMYVVKQGFRDGLHGFMLSVLIACSSALRYAMLWEMTMHCAGNKEQGDEK